MVITWNTEPKHLINSGFAEGRVRWALRACISKSALALCCDDQTSTAHPGNTWHRIDQHVHLQWRGETSCGGFASNGLTKVLSVDTQLVLITNSVGIDHEY